MRYVFLCCPLHCLVKISYTKPSSPYTTLIYNHQNLQNPKLQSPSFQISKSSKSRQNCSLHILPKNRFIVFPNFPNFIYHVHILLFVHFLQSKRIMVSNFKSHSNLKIFPKTKFQNFNHDRKRKFEI